MLAEVSNHDAEDIRAMYLEQKHKPANHGVLWEQIPVVSAMDPTNILRDVTEKEIQTPGEVDHNLLSKVVDVKALKNLLPKWDWGSIFSLLKRQWTFRFT